MFIFYIFLLLGNNIYGDYMKIRLGYACICNGISGTSSTNYTYSEYLKNNNLDKLDSVIISNLEVLEEIINYNIRNNIHFYRMSSKIIPLATKEDVYFDYINKYKDYYDRIGKKIRKSDMRVDLHPDQFAVLNSTRKEVIDNTIQIIDYHYKLLESFKIKNKILVLHIGGNTFGKDNSIKRFINNFNKLPSYLKKSLVIENDDKIFNVSDVIKISKELNIPIVLDYHHHNCNKSDFDMKDILDSWKDMIPKMHFSSPKNKKDYRNHSEYINSDDFISFIELLKKYDRDVDIMIEAKLEDDALFRLVREIKYKTNYKFIDDTTFIV